MFGAKALIEKKVWNLILLEPSIESYVIAEKSIVYTLFWNVCILSHSSEIKGLCSIANFLLRFWCFHVKFDNLKLASAGNGSWQCLIFPWNTYIITISLFLVGNIGLFIFSSYLISIGILGVILQMKKEILLTNI